MPQPRRLSALDRVFLDLDTAETPQQVGWVIRFDGAPPSLAEFRTHVEPRLDALPHFRSRIGRLRFGGPCWVPADQFSIDQHVLGVEASDDDDLRALASELLSRRLGRDQPMWRLWLVTGLDEGFAVIGHGHHTLIDGVAAVQVAMLLLDPADARLGPDSPKLLPSMRPKTVRKRRRRERGRYRRLMRGIKMMVVRGPRTALDDHGDGAREIAMGQADLKTARGAARDHGATPNDALLAASSVALTAEFESRGERPGWIKVLMPFRLSNDDRGRSAGNEISAVTVRLPIGEFGKDELFGLVAQRSKAGKALGNAGVMALLSRIAGFIPPPARPAVTRWVYRYLRFTVIVSNLRGPPVDVVLLGRTAVSIHPFVPITQRQGLSIGAMSYRGRLWIGVNANPDLVDAGQMAQRIEAAFATLASQQTRSFSAS